MAKKEEAKQSNPRKLYVAYASNKDILGVVLSPSLTLVEAYFQGTGIIPRSIEEIDPDVDGTPVISVLSSSVHRMTDGGSIRYMYRGLPKSS